MFKKKKIKKNIATTTIGGFLGSEGV